MNKRRMNKIKKSLISTYFDALVKHEEEDRVLDAMACYEEIYVDATDPTEPGVAWQFLILK